MRKYDKLVRDGIPAKIKAKGEPYTAYTASDDEFQLKLKEKLKEEVDEYLLHNEAGELADILEVIYALGALHGVGMEELERLRKSKVAKLGDFSQKIILEES